MTEESKTDLSEFRIYYDGVIKYDARYPLKESWINQVMKKWWENEQRKRLEEVRE